MQAGFGFHVLLGVGVRVEVAVPCNASILWNEMRQTDDDVRAELYDQAFNCDINMGLLLLLGVIRVVHEHFDSQRLGVVLVNVGVSEEKEAALLNLVGFVADKSVGLN